MPLHEDTHLSILLKLRFLSNGPQFIATASWQTKNRNCMHESITCHGDVIQASVWQLILQNLNLDASSDSLTFIFLEIARHLVHSDNLRQCWDCVRGQHRRQGKVFESLWVDNSSRSIPVDLMSSSHGIAAKLRELVIDLQAPRFETSPSTTHDARHLNGEQRHAVERYEHFQIPSIQEVSFDITQSSPKDFATKTK